MNLRLFAWKDSNTTFLVEHLHSSCTFDIGEIVFFFPHPSWTRLCNLPMPEAGASFFKILMMPIVCLSARIFSYDFCLKEPENGGSLFPMGALHHPSFQMGSSVAPMMHPMQSRPGLHIEAERKKSVHQVIQAVTFSSPSLRSLNHSKGSLNHPEKVTKNCQALVFLLLNVCRISN